MKHFAYFISVLLCLSGCSGALTQHSPTTTETSVTLTPDSLITASKTLIGHPWYICKSITDQCSKSIVSDTTSLQNLSTRQLGYAVYLALAQTDPQLSKTLLKQRLTTDGYIKTHLTADTLIPWPIAIGHIPLWVISAQQIYLVDGDKKWLKQIIDVANRETDRLDKISFDPDIQLYKGLSTETYPQAKQTHPAWMNQTDMAAVYSLETNASIVAMLTIIDNCQKSLGRPQRYQNKIKALKTAINDHLWMPQRGYHAIWAYGTPYPVAQPNSDPIGQYWANTTGIATPEMAASATSNLPVTSTGCYRTYPIPTGEANQSDNFIAKAIWAINANRAKNPTQLIDNLTSLLADVINQPQSTPILNASVAGAFWQGLIGIQFTPEHKIDCTPCIPQIMGSHVDIPLSKTTISITGFGTKTASKQLQSAHTDTFTVKMANNISPHEVTYSPPVGMPNIPKIEWSSDNDNRCKIANFEQGNTYTLFVNGQLEDEIQTPTYSIPTHADEYLQITLQQIASQQYVSFPTRPYRYAPNSRLWIIKNKAPTPTARVKPRHRSRPKGPDYFTAEVTLPQGRYIVSVAYYNPMLSCAILTAQIDRNTVAYIAAPSTIARSGITCAYSPTAEIEIPDSLPHTLTISNTNTWQSPRVIMSQLKIIKL